MTVQQLSDLYSVNPITVYRWLKERKLSYFQATAKGAIRVSKNAVLKFDSRYNHNSLNSNSE